ncbi:MAG: hypothetical protein KDD62_01285, partial [Bdellovibrionales bacterium]|nr:hypothetical protein [Bdellovibrionales bacterium]
NGRLSQENADARSLLLDAMFALNSGLTVPNYAKVADTLELSKEKNPKIVDEYLYSVARATVLIKQNVGTDVEDLLLNLGKALAQGKGSLPYVLAIKSQTASDVTTLYKPKVFQEIVTEGLRRDQETLSTDFHVEYAFYLQGRVAPEQVLEIVNAGFQIDEQARKLTGRTTANLALLRADILAKARLMAQDRSFTGDYIDGLKALEEGLGTFGEFGMVAAPRVYFGLAEDYSYAALISDDPAFVESCSEAALERLVMAAETSSEDYKPRLADDISTAGNFANLREDERYSSRLQAIVDRLRGL